MSDNVVSLGHIIRTQQLQNDFKITNKNWHAMKKKIVLLSTWIIMIQHFHLSIKMNQGMTFTVSTFLKTIQMGAF